MADIARIDPNTIMIDLKTGRLTRQGFQIMSALISHTMPNFTVDTLPSAAQPGLEVYVSDGTSNKRLAISDGTNWRFPDGNIVS